MLNPEGRTDIDLAPSYSDSKKPTRSRFSSNYAATVAMILAASTGCLSDSMHCLQALNTDPSTGLIDCMHPGRQYPQVLKPRLAILTFQI
jgi:hypothetical protein